MDIVYVLGRQESYEEFRYSLRSLENIDHDTVHIVGSKPTWAKNISHIKCNTKHRGGLSYFLDAEEKWIAACNSPDVSEDFILMNDDFFIMKPVEKLYNYHAGRLTDWVVKNEKISSSVYINAMNNTREILRHCQGATTYKESKSFSVHVPMVQNKEKRLAASLIALEYAKSGKPILTRTLYGNQFGLKGRFLVDPKVRKVDGEFRRGSNFLSTNDASFKFGEVGKMIRGKFNTPSQYEKQA